MTNVDSTDDGTRVGSHVHLQQYVRPESKFHSIMLDTMCDSRSPFSSVGNDFSRAARL